MPPLWVWIIIGLVVLLGVQFWAQSFGNSDEVSISQIASDIDAGRVQELERNGERIIATYNDGTTQTTTFVGALEDMALLLENPETLATIELSDRSQAGWNTFLSIVLSIGPILLLVWIFTRGFRQMQGGGNSIFGFGRSKARTLKEGERPTVTFADVAGVEEAKEEVQEVVQFLREPEKFVQVGARIPKGVLMVGPPGTGKTLLARAIAGEAGVPFFHISGSEFVEMFVGVGASRVRDLFDKAKQNAPSIVFVDEIDAVGRQRGAGLGGGHDEREQTLNQILVEMDGFSNETNVIVIAATNRVDVLDPALLRPGRFDRKVIVDLPDVKGRESILKVHARGKPIAKEVSLADMARLTAGFAGADLENLINEAAIFAARSNRNQISMIDFQDAFDRVVMGPERKSKVLTENDKEHTAYHEAGHAVVSYLLPNTDPVQKITIIPRGRAGGYMMSLPEDRSYMTREHFEDRIAMAMGGRAAEEVFFGIVSTGPAGDLQQSTDMARQMVMRYGMSDRLGLRSFGEQQSVFLGRSISADRDYSDETARIIDEEVQRIVDEQYDRSLSIIKENRERLVQVAEALIVEETLDRPRFEQLMNAEEAGTSESEASPLPA
ncbi:MAG: ATP-dependent zinc metalloprotease FtsH [Anaerolineales bacterium]|nr:ATP-dependent zinc metalloprotease FtsH [Anaerolineales bacterium]MCB0012193.1 ATP-dependent zinc metalloprotease FtsH [Anaerolineales bacterium]